MPVHEMTDKRALFNFTPYPEPGAGTAHGRRRYFSEQADRIAETVRLCIQICPDPEAVVLDVGRSCLSSCLLSYYAAVTTLGRPLEIAKEYAHTTDWEPPAGKIYAGHIDCDLNRIPTRASAEGLSRFDLIVFAEVIEHLFAAPYAALAWLRYLLGDGGVILCTTPNAASLLRRLKLLLGRNPSEPLRYDLNNPGHIHEYTKKELYELGRLAGLEVVMHRYVDYRKFRGSGVRRAIGWLVSRIVPSFAPDQIVLYRPSPLGTPEL